MTTGKARQLLLRTAQNYATIRRAHSDGDATDEQLAFAERALEQIALIFVSGLSDEERAAIARTT